MDLREAWESEPRDFTPWLAEDKNLALLSETIGIDLELEAREQAVGRFSADLLCRDTATGERVIVENQLELTDHAHLGQLLTYSAGLNAPTVIWIAREFNEEHRAALDWLNEKTLDGVRLFGLEIELWKVGDSPVAPNFNIVCKPNDWSRDLQKQATEVAELSETRQLQLRYWTAFRDYMTGRGSPVRCQKPVASNWTTHALGKTGVTLVSVMSTWDPEIRAELSTNGPSAKTHFAELRLQKDHIEASLGFPLEWVDRPDAVGCRAFAKLKADVTNPEDWPAQFEWLRLKQEAMYRVFSPLVRQLRTGPAAAGESEA